MNAVYEKENVWQEQKICDAPWYHQFSNGGVNMWNGCFEYYTHPWVQHHKTHGENEYHDCDIEYYIYEVINAHASMYCANVVRMLR